MNRLLQTVCLLFALAIGQPAFAQTKESVNKKDTIIYLPYKAGKARFSYNGKMGIIDSSGTIVLPAILTSILYPSSNRERLTFFITAGKHHGVIDTNYNVIVPPVYDYVSFFRGGWYRVKLNGRYTFVNNRGREMKAWFDDADWFSADGLRAAVKINGLWGFIDSTGAVVIQPVYKRAFGFNEHNRAAVQVKDKWGFIDINGVMKIEAQYDDVWKAFYSGSCPAKKNGKWGYIDTTGQTVIPFMYDYANPFYCELTAVKKDGRYGFINQKNETVIPFRYRKAYAFEGRNARTSVRTGFFKWFSINKQGECEFNCD